MLVGIGFGLLAALFYMSGNMLQKDALERLPDISGRHSVHMGRALVSSRQWILGAVVSVAGLAFQTFALSRAPLSVVQAVVAAGTMLFVVIALVHFREHIQGRELFGILLAIVSLVLISVSLVGGPDSVGLGGSYVTVLAVAGGTCALAIPLFVAIRERGSNASFVYGAVSGLVYGAGALGSKGISTQIARFGVVGSVGHVVASPYPYIFVACSIGALILFQMGLQRGRIGIVAPVSNVLSSTYLVAVGMAVFGEHLPTRPAEAALRIGGFIGVIAGTCFLAGREPVLSGVAAEVNAKG